MPDKTTATIDKCIIRHNKAKYGGGILVNYSEATITNCVVKYNLGVGIWIDNSIVFTYPDQRNSFYLNSNDYGYDIFTNTEIELETPFYIDTLTTSQNIEPYYIYQHETNWEIDILNYKTDLIDADIYVSQTMGSNDNSGLTPNDPFQSITHALLMCKSNEDSYNTIYINSGVYSFETKLHNVQHSVSILAVEQKTNHLLIVVLAFRKPE